MSMMQRIHMDQMSAAKCGALHAGSAIARLDPMRWIGAVAIAVAGCSNGAEPPLLPDGGMPDGAPSVNRCAGVAAQCAGGDCCAVAAIPGGTFYRGLDAAGGGDTSAPATVSAFHLDTYEITVGRFRAFVESGMGTQANPPGDGTGAHPHIAGSGWSASWNHQLPSDTAGILEDLFYCDDTTWTSEPGMNETLPVTCLTWYEAAAFCIWDDGYLPTEAEWNYAATGGDQQRAYPWSQPAADTSIDGARAVYSTAKPAAVGSRPAGADRWGVADLGGNVAEWVLDWSDSYPMPCTDCGAIAAPGAGPSRVYRGGGWDSPASDLRTGARTGAGPDYAAGSIGARCARP